MPFRQNLSQWFSFMFSRSYPLCNFAVALALLLLISLSLTSNLFGFDDWPFWRGPDRNDKSSETGLLKQWPEDGPTQLWVNKKSGLGYSGFAISGDQLFTMGLEDEKEFALCLNALTGEEIWRENLGDGYVNNWGDGPRSTPTLAGDQIFVMAAGGDLVCLNKSDGKQVWSVNMEDLGGKAPKWGYAESPLVDGEKVICTPGGGECTMVALNRKTGDKIWQSPPVTKKLEDGSDTEPSSAHYSSVMPMNLNNRRQYVQLTVQAVIGVDADTGEQLWQSDWPGRTAVIPSPIVDQDKVYITSGYGVGSKLLQIGDDNSVSELWYTKAMQNHHGGVIKVGEHFYGSSAQAWVCQNQADGENVWADRKIKKGAVVYADGMFYHVEEKSGRVLLIQASPESHSIVSSFKLSPQTKRRKPKGRIWVHPVVANGKLYLRDQEIIVCYDIKSP